MHDGTHTSALRLPAMSTSLTHGFSAMTTHTHTHSLLFSINTGTRTHTPVLHYHSAEAQFPTGQAHAQFNDFNKVGLHIKNLTGYSTTDGTEIGMQSAINHEGQPQKIVLSS